MRKLWKWLAILVSGLVLVLIAAIVAITLLVDLNQFKPLIISQFKQLTGMEMKIPGHLSWSFFPHLGMEVNQVEISNPPDFNTTIQNLILRAELRPLLHRQLEFSKITMSQLQLNHLQVTNVAAKLQLSEGILQVKPVTADFYQGHLRGDARVIFNQSSPLITISAALDNVDLASLIQAASGKNIQIYFEGKANLNADLAMKGRNAEQLLRQLNGNSRFSIDRGMIKGIDVGFYLETANALINKQPLPKRLPGNQTEFGQLTGTATIKNGIIYNNDLQLESPFYTATGKGFVNLVNRTLDYYLAVTVKAGAQQELAALTNKSIPIHISGNLDNPSIRLDTFALMQALGKEQLQRVEEKIQQVLPDKANQLIQNLLH